MYTDLVCSRLEIGAGGGLVGLAVARGCSVETPLYVTDQLEMYELMKHNIVLNNVQERARALVLNWFVPPPPRRSGKPAEDLSLGLDLEPVLSAVLT